MALWADGRCAWDLGDKASVETAATGGWRFAFPAAGAWAGSAPPKDRRDWRAGTALLLTVSRAEPGGSLTVEVVEGGGERHTATVALPAGGAGELRLPWSAFSRRSWQDRAAPADGLQLDAVRYLAFWPADGPLTIAIGRIAVVR